MSLTQSQIGRLWLPSISGGCYSVDGNATTQPRLVTPAGLLHSQDNCIKFYSLTDSSYKIFWLHPFILLTWADMFIVVDIVGIVNPAICLTNTSSLVMNINQRDLHNTYWYKCYHNSTDRSEMKIFLKIKCKSCSISSKSGGAGMLYVVRDAK